VGEHCDARHRKWTGWANPIAQALGIADRVSQAWEGEDDPPLTSLKYLQSIYRDENQAI
jgi:hypothetical protein